ncbi:salicylate 1-hydroxylase-like protein [Lophiotrema nucula]|uniref:Salicylate 1-hydroxylase-like protein n=1 Tax=Lophiotrema nucula TaxID=690887 RepID=A0A6A5ZL53_9PLEO|nr:salicylate 1-hydroxylase-like protein [Lophiotrema nucula]
MTSRSSNLAIVGGGITGLTLSISLTKHGISHTLYESAAGFGEIGAGVGFEPNFVRTMGLISPALQEAFLTCADAKRPEAFDKTPAFFQYRIGDLRVPERKGLKDNLVAIKKDGTEVKIGEKLFDWRSRPGLRGGVHRAHLLDELVKLVPPHICKFKKRLIDVMEAEDGSGDAVLSFADGTTATHSAVLGCDGIKSRTREIVLGGKEEARAVFSGKYAYRGLIPMSKAVKFMGDYLPLRSQMFAGYHGHVLTFPIAKGTIMNVVAFSSRPTWESEKWVVDSSREEMLKDYETWSPMIKELIAAMPEKPDIWALFNHRPAKTYHQTKPKIVLVGDAAHASTPHQGAGAGVGVEDCYILGEILAAVSGNEDLEKAFKVYDEIRRPRSLKLVETSRTGAQLYELESELGDDFEAIEDRMETRMDWLWDYDIAEDREKALQILKGSANAGSSARL